MELLAALTNNFRTLATDEAGQSGDEDDEDEDEDYDREYDDEDYDDEQLAAMMAGAEDGWEPYDPSAYE
jgi:hypothetical protein